MTDDFDNVYADVTRAASYARLEFPGTYALAFRDLPEIFAAHIRGRHALDFGCGTGRSTRYLRAQGFDAEGIDIASEMIAHARALDPTGRYTHVPAAAPPPLPAGAYDLVFAAFTFDNMPERVAALASLRASLAPAGRLVAIVSTPEIYTHEWTSFSTRAYPENRTARSGDTVRIVMLDVDDARPVQDVVCDDAAYRAAFADAGLDVEAMYQPLGREDDGIAWVSESRVAPWSIYVLARRES